jgi:hypothetical protein
MLSPILNASPAIALWGFFFVRNVVAIHAEMRAGFGIIQPSAFCKVPHLMCGDVGCPVCGTRTSPAGWPRPPPA